MFSRAAVDLVLGGVEKAFLHWESISSLRGWSPRICVSN